MTTQDDFTRQLERYLDDYEGPTPLPETVRNAVRAVVPRTKQSRSVRGPARYFMMNSNPMAPIALALAAAVLTVAVGSFIFARPDVGGPDDVGPSAQASSSPDAAASASPATACSESTADPLGGGAIEVVWCSARGGGVNIPLTFTLEAPMTWFEIPGEGFSLMFGNRRQLWIRPYGGGAITMVLPEDQSVDEVVADISARTGYLVENSTPVTIGGAPGTVFDVRLAEGASSGDAPPLIVGDDQSWVLQADNMARVWVVDHAGETVMVVTGQELADDLGASLETLDWAD